MATTAHPTVRCFNISSIVSQLPLITASDEIHGRVHIVCCECSVAAALTNASPVQRCADTFSNHIMRKLTSSAICASDQLCDCCDQISQFLPAGTLERIAASRC
jgi:hypothetical protein